MNTEPDGSSPYRPRDRDHLDVVALVAARRRTDRLEEAMPELADPHRDFHPPCVSLRRRHPSLRRVLGPPERLSR
ncbi:MAG TPA: hypothetical protein VKG38_04940 [Solirubrobacteraceae bacterium]|nr:hypothetical protein [Solirubrobacteraceae bacterium]